MNKVVRFEIIKPIDCDWKEFGNVLNELSYKTRYILNKCIQAHWDWDNLSFYHKQKYNTYLNTETKLGYKGTQAVQNYLKNQIKDHIINFNSGNVDATLDRATKRWKTDKKEIITGEKSISSFKKDCPIDIRPKMIDIIKDKNNYYFNLSLISNLYKKELNRKSGQFLVLVKVKSSSQKAILEKILSGEYGKSASQIISVKKGSKTKWFINLSYKFEPELKELNQDIIMGIDMGMKYPVYFAFNNSDWNRGNIEGGEIDRFRKQVEKRRIQLLNQGKYCGEGRIGHGRNTRIKPIEVLTNKIANFRDTTNHKYSKYIIEQAIKQNAGIIQMEDLTGISKDKNFLKNWSYYDLQTKIEYKAKEVGIKVVKIDPKYTSQRCHKCGFIHKENRETQSEFKCLSCGESFNADFNAAKNIANKNIEFIIKEQLRMNVIASKEC